MNQDKKIQATDAPPGDFFVGVLRDMRDVKMLHQLDKGIQRLIGETLRTGSKGKITLTLTVAKRGADRQVLITPKLKLDVPDDELRNSLLFADESGRLYQDDPAQGQLDFDAPRKVSAPAAAPATEAGVPKRVNG